VLAFGEELLKPALGFRNGVRACNAETRKAVFARDRGKRSPERGRIGQKSRSA
jgi:hypothetical protein